MRHPSPEIPVVLPAQGLYRGPEIMGRDDHHCGSMRLPVGGMQTGVCRGECAAAASPVYARGPSQSGIGLAALEIAVFAESSRHHTPLFDLQPGGRHGYLASVFKILASMK